jgi:hypothetical protein
MQLSGFHRNLFFSTMALPCAVICLSSCSTKSVAPPVASTGMASTGPAAGQSGDQTKGTPEKLPGASEFKFEKPQYVRGIYLTAWSAGSTRKMEKMFALLDKTELNSVVIDVRDDGEMYWKTEIPLAKEVGANQIAVSDSKKLMKSLSEHKVYPIARIACFRDAFVPKKRVDQAVQVAGGGVWMDRTKHTWLDPYNKKNWEYIAQTVEYALDQGFPEIQLDYVRFPSEGKSATQVFPARKSYDNPKALPEDVIADFCAYIREKVKARGAMFSADIFGIISSNKGSEGIGQQLEKVAEPFDIICPMVYPSHFAMGEYGIANPNVSPYLIVRKSLNDYKGRLPKKAVRPWLQDFFHYGVPQIKAQIKAAKEVGYEEYLIWNAGNRFTEAAYIDNSKLLADKTVAANEKDPHADKKDAAKPVTQAAATKQ